MSGLKIGQRCPVCGEGILVAPSLSGLECGNCSAHGPALEAAIEAREMADAMANVAYTREHLTRTYQPEDEDLAWFRGSPPLVAGGQSHAAADVRDAGWGCLWLVVAGVAFAVTVAVLHAMGVTLPGNWR